MVSKAEAERLALRRRIWERDGKACTLCSSPVDLDAMDLDHIVAVADDGSDDETNLRCTHPSCNRSRGGKTGWHFRLNPRPRAIHNTVLTVPGEMAEALRALAKQEGRSMHGQVLHILRQFVKEEQAQK